jgi:ubiquinone/menaquinone biosynthesis C-methylase UbiE
LKELTASSSEDAGAIQKRYYTLTADRYDEMHSGENHGDPQVQKLTRALLNMIEPRSLLEVGAGTGMGIRNFRETIPEAFVCGIEPVAALVEKAGMAHGLPAGLILQARGEALPFGDRSFDVVCSFGVLHHVPRPNAVVDEMLRVARKAVIVVDSNRFGQGSWPTRIFKFVLYKVGLWGTANYLKTGGKGYMITEGDGLAYSYSVYDSFDNLAKWADQLMVIPVGQCSAKSWLHPILTSGGVLACAMKK